MSYVSRRSSNKIDIKLDKLQITKKTMGIFNFFKWFKDTFPNKIYKIRYSLNEISVTNDNLMIDMNGLFHTSAQKIYKYGNYKPPFNIVIADNKDLQQKVFKDVCKTIEHLITVVNPNKRVILCVDGSAPLAKQIQQARRRYVSSLSRVEDDVSFDSNNISPGTLFMHHLNQYIDFFIKLKMTENPLWHKLEIIFSNEKVPCEGEAKLMSYLRKYGKKNESFIFYGLDADLIMLSLISHFPNIYILREDTFDKKNNFLFIDIPKIIPELLQTLRWEAKIQENEYEPSHKFIPEWGINDFVFLAFMVGNDFLHHIPTLEIIEGGIHVIINSYKEIASTYGHITRVENGKTIISLKALQKFLESIDSYESTLLNKKFKNRNFYFPDQTLIDSSLVDSNGTYTIDVNKYHTIFCEKHFNYKEEENDEAKLEIICHQYLDGLQWVLQYYSQDVPDWNWFFPYHYTPPAKFIAKYIDSYTRKVFRKNKPMLPFQQLMSIIPQKSSSILPKPLNTLIQKHENIHIDLSGKKYEYQGIVLLPFIDISKVNKTYNDNFDKLEEKDRKRNIFGKSYVYTFNASSKKIFNSYYGSISPCLVNLNEIIL
jgi:5'-3' exoribonuclease 1